MNGCTMQDVMDTLVFVDVDGVLNIGVQDLAGKPLAFSEGNLRTVLAHADHPCPDMARVRTVAARTIEREGGAFYAKLVATSNNVSFLLVARLAHILRVAAAMGGAQRVVLSSNWRSQSHKNRVQQLEALISAHLGKPFSFDDRTRLQQERCASDRLECIGNYVEEFCRKRARNVPLLRILVLDDFFMTELIGMSCGGFAIDSVSASEQYLLSRVADVGTTSICVVHTYEQLAGEDGVPFSIGCGLTMKFFSSALMFLGWLHGPDEEEAWLAKEREGIPCEDMCQKGPTATSCSPFFSGHMLSRAWRFVAQSLGFQPK